MSRLHLYYGGWLALASAMQLAKPDSNKEFAMNISNVGQSFAAANLQSIKPVAPSAFNKESNAGASEPAAPRAVDMRNISLNEINELIKAGVDGLLDIVPAMPVSIYQPYIGEDAANTKVDYLGQIEGYIAFDRSQGKNTAFLEHVLGKVKVIDGTKFPAKVDVTA
jgi:hypothetical protein